VKILQDLRQYVGGVEIGRAQRHMSGNVRRGKTARASSFSRNIAGQIRAGFSIVGQAEFAAVVVKKSAADQVFSGGSDG